VKPLSDFSPASLRDIDPIGVEAIPELCPEIASSPAAPRNDGNEKSECVSFFVFV